MRTTALFAAATLLASTAAIAQSVDEKGASPAYGEQPTYNKAGPPTGNSVDSRISTGIGPLASVVTLTKAEHYFIDRAVQGNMAEIQMAELALDQPNLRDDVASYARTILQAHKNAQESLADFTNNYDIDVPDTVTPQQQQTLKRLEAMSEDEFAEGFINAQVESHIQSIALYEPEAAKKDDTGAAVNTPLIDYAAKTLPVLRAHLELAQALRAEMSPTASAQ